MSSMENKKFQNPNEYIKALNGNDAIRILLKLCEDKELRKHISTLVMASLSDVKTEDIADNVFRCLNSIQVEDLWDNAGNTHYGYKHDTEVAFEMLEDELQHFIQKMKQYRKLDMKFEEKECCKGIISGLLKYAELGDNEFHDWVPDDPYTIADNILYDWKKENSEKDIEEVQAVYDSYFLDDEMDDV